MTRRGPPADSNDAVCEKRRRLGAFSFKSHQFAYLQSGSSSGDHLRIRARFGKLYRLVGSGSFVKNVGGNAALAAGGGMNDVKNAARHLSM